MSYRAAWNWKGKSGEWYTFFVYSLDELPVPAGEGRGNYIYVRLYRGEDNKQRYQPIYIGEGKLSDRSDLASHERRDCIRNRGATHFHCHYNSDEDDRVTEERDLLALQAAAYTPTGCNRKKGG